MLGAEAALGEDIGLLNEGHASTLLETIGMAFAEAGDLFRFPARPGPWTIEDVTLLQAQGRASRSLV